MIKLKALKTTLIKKGIICFVIVAVLSGILYFAMQGYDDAEEKKTSAERDLRQTRTQISQLEQKFDIYESSFSAFNDIETSLLEGEFALDIDTAKKTIDTLRKEHRISNLRLNIAPQEQFGQKNSDYTGYEPVFREVSLEFSALSDAHIYTFMNMLKEQLSGLQRITNIDIKKSRPLSNDILKDVRRGSTPLMAQVETSFLWIGIKTTEDNGESNAP